MAKVIPQVVKGAGNKVTVAKRSFKEVSTPIVQINGDVVTAGYGLTTFFKTTVTDEMAIEEGIALLIVIVLLLIEIDMVQLFIGVLLFICKLLQV